MIVRWKDNIVEIGAGRPVVIQSMTNTDTADVESSTKQVLELAQAGSELVRLTVNTPAAAKAIPEIRRRLDEAGCFVPLVGDFHYNGHKLLTEYPECAEALSKYRINPGNVGKGDKQEENFRTMIELAKKYDKPVRIGVNWGSLDQDLLARMMSENQKLENPLDAKEVLREALVRSAVENADRAVELGMKPSQVAISAKVSGVKDLIAVYRELEARCAYPLHLGLTEAGMGLKGTVSTTAALSVLLLENIVSPIFSSRSTESAPAGKYRRYDPCFADTGTEPVSYSGSRTCVRDPAGSRDEELHASGCFLPGLRTHDQLPLPGAGKGNSGFY